MTNITATGGPAPVLPLLQLRPLLSPLLSFFPHLILFSPFLFLPPSFPIFLLFQAADPAKPPSPAAQNLFCGRGRLYFCPADHVLPIISLPIIIIFPIASCQSHLSDACE